MSNKHFRRVEGALLLKNSQSLEEENKSDSDSEKKTVAKLQKVNKFALLEEEEISQKSHQEDSNVKNNTKSVPKISNQKTASKKKKKKAVKKKAKDDLNDLNDLFDFNNLSISNETSCTASNVSKQILRVDPRALNPDNELRKLLGKTFSRAMDADQRPNAANNRFHRTIRSKLVKPNPAWPPLSQLGIFMSLEYEKAGVKWYRFQHNENYQELQQHFWIFQMQMDYENVLNSIMTKNPYHLDSLLLLSEYMRVQEDAQSSRDALERGLCACESAFHSSFQLLSMDYRLNYEWRENRAFYLFLHYYLLSLIQRNCFSTALEFTKIIFMKDPVNDPLAVLLLIDSMALKAKKYQFCIDFYNQFKEEKKLHMLPNFLYSIAVAHFMLANTTELATKKNESSLVDPQEAMENAEKCLETALSRFPFLLGQILDKLQIKADAAVEKKFALSTLAFHKENEGLRLISDIYLRHSLEIWKLPNVLFWLESTTHKILPKLSSSAANGLQSTVNEWATKRKNCFVGIPCNILRHAILHSVRPDECGSNSSFVDPCPPEKTFSDYKPFDLNDLRNNFGSEAQNPGVELSTNTLLELVRSLLPAEYQPQLATVGENLRTYVSSLLDQLIDNLNTSEVNPQQQQNIPIELPIDNTNPDTDEITQNAENNISIPSTSSFNNYIVECNVPSSPLADIHESTNRENAIDSKDEKSKDSDETSLK